ncbi:cystinosin homolog, partial [Halyomorpha halys]|uniref:cystinosin homolog n=1 Tax=Halyomorpha halys TaxID=286706 RepID=UPI0006D51384
VDRFDCQQFKDSGIFVLFSKKYTVDVHSLVEAFIGSLIGRVRLRSTILANDVSLEYSSNHVGLVNVSIEGDGKSGPPWKVLLTGEHPGHVVISFNLTKNITDVSKAFVRITVMRSTDLEITSVVVGWLYFVAWSVSFYPQVYENWRRKSVVGLNFDFLSLNLIGFTLYSIFNCGLYWIPAIQQEYFSLHPKGLNPVQLNDIFFSLHAVGITLITIIQCLIYERGGQTVSWTAHGIIGIYLLVVAVALILSLFTSFFSWLSFINTCSYLKLVTTLIKYIPQAYMNYKRKSTIGWSIGNVVLDFTGGILSMLQMIINADNYDDWASIFGDPTKFGLGFFSVLFDILFLVQHYILYRVPIYEVIPGDVSSGPENPTDLESAGGKKSENPSTQSSRKNSVGISGAESD